MTEAGLTRRRLWRQPAEQKGMFPVFVLTLATLAVSPFLADNRWGGVLTVVLIGGAAVLSLRRTGAHTNTRRLAVAIVGFSTLAAASGPLVSDGTDATSAIEVASAALFTLLLLVTPAIVITRLLMRPRITLDTMAGAMAAYLQIGLLFASAFRLVSLVQDQPFFAEHAAPTSMDFEYFSFVTLTTVGYGDLTAATDLGRTLCVLEAVLGQVFLVTVVALVVGNLGRELPHRRRDHEQDPAT